MPIFGGRHYVPILTWKRAEQCALEFTPAATKAQLTPLLELVPVPVDLKSGKQTKSLQAHVDYSIGRIATAWSATADFFLDPKHVASDLSPTGNGAGSAYARAQTLGLSFIPTIGLNRPSAEISAALAYRQRGICLRLHRGALEDTVTLASRLDAFMTDHRLEPSYVDLVLDLESVHESTYSAIAQMAQRLLSAIPTITAWRTLTLAGCSFPGNLGGVQGVNYRDRSEWLAWSAIYPTRGLLPRMPAFGDYAIQSPDKIEGYDPRFMPMSPAIRYTTDKQWLVIRGRSSKQQRLATQFPALASLLVTRPQFFGAAHCCGCADAVSCANGQSGFGSPAVWRRIGTTHHLVLASAQVAALPAP